MSKYEHGNWYCKPANTTEAEEIVARAVASGAVDHNRNWAFTARFYGVCDGVVKTYSVGTKYTIKQVREKFPLPDELDKSLPPIGKTYQHTNGGVYRVTGYANEKTTKPDQYPVNIIYRNVVNGTIWCRPASEWARSFTPVNDEPTQEYEGETFPPVGWHGEVTWGRKVEWHECVICPGCVAYESPIGRWITDVPSSLPGFEFRPLRNERERWIEDAAVFAHKDAVLTPEQSSFAAGVIYDAIKAGTLAAPEVE